MTDGEETIDGVITQINAWNSGKGQFVKIDSLDADFFKFGGFVSQVGDTVRLHYKPGKGNYSDKFEILRTEKLVAGATPKPPTKEQAEFKPASEIPKAVPKTNDISGNIRRSVTLKCASRIYIGLNIGKNQENIVSICDQITELAKLLEPYIEHGKSD